MVGGVLGEGGRVFPLCYARLDELVVRLFPLGVQGELLAGQLFHLAGLPRTAVQFRQPRQPQQRLPLVFGAPLLEPFCIQVVEQVEAEEEVGGAEIHGRLQGGKGGIRGFAERGVQERFRLGHVCLELGHIGLGGVGGVPLQGVVGGQEERVAIGRVGHDLAQAEEDLAQVAPPLLVGAVRPEQGGDVGAGLGGVLL